MTDPLRGHRETDQVGRHEERRADDALLAGHPERLVAWVGRTGEPAN